MLKKVLTKITLKLLSNRKTRTTILCYALRHPKAGKACMKFMDYLGINEIEAVDDK